jgi:hypothetical protein
MGMTPPDVIWDDSPLGTPVAPHTGLTPIGVTPLTPIGPTLLDLEEIPTVLKNNGDLKYKPKGVKKPLGKVGK